MARVLIIDDDPDFCRMMETLLTNAGHDVTLGPHSIIAAEDAISGNYDVITLDVRMPDLDGADLSQLFHEVSLETPVIVLSGHLTDEVTADLERAGISRIMRKPFKNADLLAAIEEAAGATAAG